LKKIYNLIFGSQINLLKKLNEGPKHKDFIDSYCKTIIDSHDEMSKWDIKTYLNFLFDNTLIIFNEKKKRMQLLTMGMNF